MLSDDSEREQPPRELSAWTVDRLEALTATRQGRGLELIRTVAQSHAYQSDESRSARLRWARLSLAANERLPGGTPWEDTRKACQDFALRTWVIGHLGPGSDRDWDPGALAADTLAALALDPDQALVRSAHWRTLPLEEIGELRRHKNLTAHLDRLMGFVPEGPTKDRLVAWADVRGHLP
ncbi:hypothetical protein ACWERV_04405 [Streptomyces sp. NPDC004031]